MDSSPARTWPRHPLVSTWMIVLLCCCRPEALSLNSCKSRGANTKRDVSLVLFDVDVYLYPLSLSLSFSLYKVYAVV